jgi:hypothetical protein
MAFRCVGGTALARIVKATAELIQYSTHRRLLCIQKVNPGGHVHFERHFENSPEYNADYTNLPAARRTNQRETALL